MGSHLLSTAALVLPAFPRLHNLGHASFPPRRVGAVTTRLGLVGEDMHHLKAAKLQVPVRVHMGVFKL